MIEKQPRIALLIDADNSPASKIDVILAELAKVGVTNIRRAYGNWKKDGLKGWEAVLHEYAIRPIQLFDYSKGKNATDIGMVIEAMDLLYTDQPDAYGIVSSDSDFTRLASRLREEGAVVYGFGAKKTPEAFRNACSRFIYIENLLAVPAAGAEASASPATTEAKKEPPSSAIPIIVKAMEELEDDDGWAQLGEIGQRIPGIAPDFDPRSYGCPNLSTVVSKSGGFELLKSEGGRLRIRRKPGRRATGAEAEEAPAPRPRRRSR